MLHNEGSRPHQSHSSLFLSHNSEMVFGSVRVQGYSNSMPSSRLDNVRTNGRGCYLHPRLISQKIHKGRLLWMGHILPSYFEAGSNSLPRHRQSRASTPCHGAQQGLPSCKSESLAHMQSNCTQCYHLSRTRSHCNVNLAASHLCGWSTHTDSFRQCIPRYILHT